MKQVKHPGRCHHCLKAVFAPQFVGGHWVDLCVDHIPIQAHPPLKSSRPSTEVRGNEPEAMEMLDEDHSLV